MNNQRGTAIWRTVRLCGLVAAISVFFVLAGCVTTKRVSAPPSGACADAVPADADNPDSIAAAQLRLELEYRFEQYDRYRLAQDHFIVARDYERRGMDDMAGRMYEAAFDFWPESRFLRKLLLDRYMRTEEYQKALLLFQEDENLEDLTPEERRSISLIYLRLGNVAKAAAAVEALGDAKSDDEMYSLGLLYESIGDRGKSLQHFREFFHRNPRSAGMGVRVVRFNLSERKFAEAESLAVILRSAYPQNAEVAALLGTVKHMQRDTTAAFKHFRDALAIDSLNEEALRTLAHIHLLREEYKEAVLLYKRLIEQEGIGVIYRRSLGILFYHMKEYAEAEKMFDVLIAEKDSSGVVEPQELYFYRGLLYAQTDRRDKASADMRAAVAISPKYEDAWQELCYMHIIAKDTAEAHKAVEGYAAAFPESGTVWRFRGYVRNMQKKPDEAIAALHRAVEINPADFPAWFELGNTFETLKRRNEASEAYKTALILRPDDPVLQNNLAYVWSELGINLDSANVLVQAALKKYPTSGAFLDTQAWVLYKLGDYDKALHYMNEALKSEDMESEALGYEHLGDIQFKRKDYAAAEKAYKQAIKLTKPGEDVTRMNERLKEIKELMRKKGE